MQTINLASLPDSRFIVNSISSDSSDYILLASKVSSYGLEENICVVGFSSTNIELAFPTDEKLYLRCIPRRNGNSTVVSYARDLYVYTSDDRKQVVLCFAGGQSTCVFTKTSSIKLVLLNVILDNDNIRVLVTYVFNKVRTVFELYANLNTKELSGPIEWDFTDDTELSLKMKEKNGITIPSILGGSFHVVVRDKAVLEKSLEGISIKERRTL